MTANDTDQISNTSSGGTAEHARPDEGGASFEAESREILHRVRASFRDLMAAVPGTTRRAADVSRSLALDKRTAWQLFKIISSDDPLTSAMHVPTGATAERVLRAATDRGAPAATTEAVRAATRAFDGLIARYAGDRSLFDTMVAAAVDADAPVDLAHYRAAFRANTHIYRAFSGAHSSCHIYHRSLDDPTLLDVAMLRGHHDLCHAGASPFLCIDRTRLVRDTDPAQARREPILPDSGHNVGLIPEFSTVSPSQFSLVERAKGLADFQLRMLGPGLPGRMTFVFGHVLRNVAKVRKYETDDTIRSALSVRTIPTKSGTLNVLVHTPTFGIVEPEVFWQRTGDGQNLNPAEHPERLLTLPPDCLSVLAGGIDSLATPELPRQADLVRWALDRLGWAHSEFQVFRCRVEYPLVPSSLSLVFPLPE